MTPATVLEAIPRLIGLSQNASDVLSQLVVTLTAAQALLLVVGRVFPAASKVGHFVGIGAVDLEKSIGYIKRAAEAIKRNPGGGAAVGVLVAVVAANAGTACSPAALASARAAATAAAPYVDPLLRTIGFCREHAPERVAAIESAVKRDDKLGAVLEAALVVEDLRTAGVKIPPEIDVDLVRAVAGVEGVVRGLRALDCRDRDGNPIPGCAP